MDVVYELSIGDINEPDSSGLDLRIERTDVLPESIEISVSGILNSKAETLGVAVSRKDALALMKTLRNALGD